MSNEGEPAAAAADSGVIDLSQESDGEDIDPPYSLRQRPPPSPLKVTVKQEPREKPQVVTPRKEKRAKIAAADCGAVGYRFFKKFEDGWHSGEVTAILSNTGFDRQCRYSTGGEEELSLEELLQLPAVGYRFKQKDDDGMWCVGEVIKFVNDADVDSTTFNCICKFPDGFEEEKSLDELKKLPRVGREEDNNRKSPPEECTFASSSSDDDASLFGSEEGDAEAEEEQPEPPPQQSSNDDDASLFGSEEGDTEEEGDAKEEPLQPQSDDDEASLFGSEEGNVEEQQLEPQPKLQPPNEENTRDSDSDDDESLFSEPEEQERQPPDGENNREQQPELHLPNGNTAQDDDDESLFSLSDDEKNSFFHLSEGAPDEVAWIARDPPPKEEPKTAKKGSLPCTFAEYEPIRVIRREPYANYLSSSILGKRILVNETDKVDSSGEFCPPDATIFFNGKSHQLIHTEYKKGGKGPIKDDGTNGRPRFKSYYLAKPTGPGEFDVATELARIANFGKLVPPCKAASRLKLLVSAACRSPDGKRMLMHRLPTNKFEVFDDGANESHQGCGFIPRELFWDLLGRTKPAFRKNAIQVRLFSPTVFGVAKGVLVIKPDITKIQVPQSMIKAEKSDSALPPIHLDVVVVITQVFPSENNYTLERLIDDRKEPPTGIQIQNLKVRDDELTYIKNVLEANGVGRALLHQYFKEFNGECDGECGRYNHSWLVGVSDPTGSIPAGHVFLTGMRTMLPREVFLTRSPCTEADDGRVVPVASSNHMPEESYDFLANMPFGSVVFSTRGDPLPPQINDSDCDGDRFSAFWDHEIIEAIHNHHPPPVTNDYFLTDDVIKERITFKYNKEFNAEVTAKVAESPDTYEVQLTSRCSKKKEKEKILMTRADIFHSRDSIYKVLSHKTSDTKPPRVEFEIAWHSGSTDWRSMQDVRKMFTNDPPLPLVKYVKYKKGFSTTLGKCNYSWLQKSFSEVEDVSLEKITGHRTKNGTAQVQYHYNDGDNRWVSLEEAKNEAKLELCAYWFSEKRKLSKCEEWAEVKNFWHDEVTKFMRFCSSEFDGIRCELSRRYKKACEEHGPNHAIPIAWGRAFKRSIDMEKHGGKVKLPLSLHVEVSKNNQKHVEIA